MFCKFHHVSLAGDEGRSDLLAKEEQNAKRAPWDSKWDCGKTPNITAIMEK